MRLIQPKKRSTTAAVGEASRPTRSRSAIPKDLPPRSTVHGYLDLWDYDGTLERIHHALFVQCRERAGREASPTAGIIDSQSVKGAEQGLCDRLIGLRRR